jgi:cytochrome c
MLTMLTEAGVNLEKLWRAPWKVAGWVTALLVLISLAACGDRGSGSLSEAAKRGEAVFAAHCSQCHRFDDGGSPGPPLAGIIGRPAGTGAFAYSEAMRLSGITWTPEALERFLEAPRETIPDNQMAFFGMPEARMRADLVEFIVTASEL